jgi:streptogramin lyase
VCRRLISAVLAAVLYAALASPGAGAVTITEHPTLTDGTEPTMVLAAPGGRVFFDAGQDVAFSLRRGTGPPGIGVYDPATGRTSLIALSARPRAMGLAGGALWALAHEYPPQSMVPNRFPLYRVDLATGAVTTHDFGWLMDIAAAPAGDALYAVRNEGPYPPRAVGNLNHLIRIDPASGAVTDVHTFPDRSDVFSIGVANDGAVWATEYFFGETDPSGIGTANRLVRIDPATGAAQEFPLTLPAGMYRPSPGRGADMWIGLHRGGGLPALAPDSWGVGHADPAAGSTLAERGIAVVDSITAGFAVGPDNAIWYGVTAGEKNGLAAIVRLDPDSGTQQVLPPAGAQAGLEYVAKSADGRTLWFAGSGSGSLTEVSFQSGGLDSGNAETVIANGMTVGVACPRDCSGSAAVEVPATGHAAQAARTRRLTIATRRFSYGARRATRLVRLRVTRRGKARLRSRRQVRAVVRVSVRLKGGRKRTTVRRVILRR